MYLVSPDYLNTLTSKTASPHIHLLLLLLTRFGKPQRQK